MAARTTEEVLFMLIHCVLFIPLFVGVMCLVLVLSCST